MIKATYTNHVQTVTLEFPNLPGETDDDVLHRIAPKVRDALKIPPAPPTDPVRWAEILAKVKK